MNHLILNEHIKLGAFKIKIFKSDFNKVMDEDIKIHSLPSESEESKQDINTFDQKLKGAIKRTTTKKDK